MNPLLLILAVAIGAGCGGSDDPIASSDSGTAIVDTAPLDSGGASDTSTSEVVAETSAPTTCTEPPAGSVVKVTVSELKALIDSGAKLTVIDVREPSETSAGVIAGALLLPWVSGVLQARHAEVPKDRPLYITCQSGGRSAKATGFLSENGHACIHDMQGGMLAWNAASYPTVRP